MIALYFKQNLCDAVDEPNCARQILFLNRIWNDRFLIHPDNHGWLAAAVLLQLCSFAEERSFTAITSKPPPQTDVNIPLLEHMC